MALHRYAKLIYLALVLLIVVFIQIGIRTGQRPDMITESSREASFKPMAQKLKEEQAMMQSAEAKFVAAAAASDPDSDELIDIPAGNFTMGIDGGQLDQEPARKVYLDAFRIGKYEVTFRDYYHFMAETGHRKPRLAGYLAVESSSMHLLMQPENPVVGISWFDAQDYCEWKKRRLPTEAEWEKAARGTDGRKWPWGNEEVPQVANLVGFKDGFGFLAPVQAFRQDKSPYGVFDLAGNAMEWVSDWYGDDYYHHAPARNPAGPQMDAYRMGPDRAGFRVIRGASWNDSIKRAMTMVRFRAYPEYRDVTIGFRCATDA
jgi:formylglycine-generating enzyme required for sulfatase activity